MLTLHCEVMLPVITECVNSSMVVEIRIGTGVREAVRERERNIG